MGDKDVCISEEIFAVASPYSLKRAVSVTPYRLINPPTGAEDTYRNAPWLVINHFFSKNTHCTNLSPVVVGKLEFK